MTMTRAGTSYCASSVSVYVPAPITEVTTTSTAMSNASLTAKGHHTDFWDSTDATIQDQLSRIRIKELHIEVQATGCGQASRRG